VCRSHVKALGVCRPVTSTLWRFRSSRGAISATATATDAQVWRSSDRVSPGRPDSIAGAVRSKVRALDPALPIDDVVVLSDAVQSQIANPRLVALTLNGFATTASALAALGLGTLIAWQVKLRTREIGVRLALGATPQQVIGIVMDESIPVVAVGVGAGLAAAAIALLSSFVTARSAARIDPLVALRD